MPVLTVFALVPRKGRHVHKIRNAPVMTFYETPNDWSDLKETLLEVARNIYHKFDLTTADISIYQYLKKRYIRSLVNYRRHRIHYNKQLVFTAKVTYMRRPIEVRVKSACFVDPEWYYRCKDGYDELERGKNWQKWELPKLPGIMATLMNPDTLFTEPLNVRLPSYGVQPKNLYMPQQVKAHTHGAYAGVPRNLYAGRRQRVVSRDKREEENRL